MLCTQQFYSWLFPWLLALKKRFGITNLVDWKQTEYINMFSSNRLLKLLKHHLKIFLARIMNLSDVGTEIVIFSVNLCYHFGIPLKNWKNRRMKFHNNYTTSSFSSRPCFHPEEIMKKKVYFSFRQNPPYCRIWPNFWKLPYHTLYELIALEFKASKLFDWS